MIYNVDFDKWVLQILPSFLRRRIIFALVRAAIQPLKSLHSSFLKSRQSHICTLTHNGQVCYLRAILNETFATTNFDIIDYKVDDGDWLYAKNESLTDQLYAVSEVPPDDSDVQSESIPILYDDARLNLAQNSFIVQVPSAVYSTQLDKVKSIVDRYRPLSKTAIYVMIN